MRSSQLFTFDSKAQVLKKLSSNSEFNIPTIFILQAVDWFKCPSDCLNNIKQIFPKSVLVIRSSCSYEDNNSSSGAGIFESFLNIDSEDDDKLTNAINKVISSYNLSPKALETEHVLVQQMAQNIVVSGVICTKTVTDGAPYYVINYDDESGRTDTITGGIGVSKTVSIYRGVQATDFDSDRLYQLVRFAKKIEQACNSDELDIEFGMNQNGVIHLFQVRPLCSNAFWDKRIEKQISNKIKHIINFFTARFTQTSQLYGHKTILGVMPDWNPAEMIGVTPRPLASSLYRELITRRVWSMAREAMGYKAIPPEELMVLVAGRPYIDVRVSFNSFLPDGLNRTISEKLVSAWLDRLNARPDLHDKVEFCVAQTVMDFCFDQNMQERYPSLLSAEELSVFRNSLIELTKKCVNVSSQGSLSRAETDIEMLAFRQKNRTLPAKHHLSHLTSYMEECQILGTHPFSILARHGFIAESFLQSAISRGALDREKVTLFKSSVSTVSSKLSEDFQKVLRGEISKETFLREYGHLRPGTYDILSPCYANRQELFSYAHTIPAIVERSPVEFSQREVKNVSQLLKEIGLEVVTPQQLFSYIQRAIQGREYAKFVFTRNVSDILEMLSSWGQRYGFSRDDLSYLNICDVINWNSISLLRTPVEHFREQVEQGRDLFALSKGLQLSYFIRSSSDVLIAPQHRNAPNFVGVGVAEANIVTLDAHTLCDIDIAGHIVCIENADPGFDWIFTRNIKGLVTRFGGTNSHMAIRCAEYSLPAAIGVGDKLFMEISNAKRCLLNVDGRLLHKL